MPICHGESTFYANYARALGLHNFMRHNFIINEILEILKVDWKLNLHTYYNVEQF